MTCLEKGGEYELVPVAYGSAEHLAMHPFGRMPVLGADGRMRTWMSVCADYVFRDVVRRIPRDREPAADELTTARAALERTERMVGDGEFLVGETLTLADLYLAPQVSNCREKAPQLLEGLPALAAWFAGIQARESFLHTSYAV